MPDTHTVAFLKYPQKPTNDIVRSDVDNLLWPLGFPENLKGFRIGDLGENYEIVISPSDVAWFGRRPDLKARLSVMFAEPKALHSHHYIKAVLTQFRFAHLLFADPGFAKLASNAIVFNGAATNWVKLSLNIDFKKSKSLSLIASQKNDLPGHKLRHMIADHAASTNVECDLMGRGYREITTKEEGLLPYRFSITIENSQEKSYFTEKLIDCFLCKTIPIYWGAPDVGAFFDTRGMMVCNSREEIENAIASITSQMYHDLARYVDANYQTALTYCDVHSRAARLLEGMR